jgi:hypothetical protein
MTWLFKVHFIISNKNCPGRHVIIKGHKIVFDKSTTARSCEVHLDETVRTVSIKANCSLENKGTHLAQSPSTQELRRLLPETLSCTTTDGEFPPLTPASWTGSAELATASGCRNSSRRSYELFFFRTVRGGAGVSCVVVWRFPCVLVANVIALALVSSWRTPVTPPDGLLFLPSDLFKPSSTVTVSSRECDEGSNKLDQEGIPMISTFEETEEQMVVINKS